MREGGSGHPVANTSPAGGRYTIDIDTGGTFTDCYVTGADRVALAKADTTPHDLSQGVLASIDHAARLLGLGRRALLQRCEAVRLSTTVGTNTFINRNGAKVGLLVGERLAAQLDTLSPHLPLASERVIAVPEEIGPKTASRAREATRTLLERGARILVIALSGGADLPRRETALRRLIAEDYPRHYLGAVPVLSSHQVTPVVDGIVRIQTAVLNAYIHPVMGRFLYRVEDQLRADGLAQPMQVGNANGGTSRVAKTSALRTWGSGPAGGVSGTAEMARRLGLRQVVAVDIGGTSADIGIVVDGVWDQDAAPAIEGVTVALPSLRMESAGVGCGSIVRVRDGRLTVGPDSAGAQPGPAAFGLGSPHATVTDAACCLGVFDPARFLGGRRSLDLAAARRAIESQAAKPLGLSIEAAAQRVLAQAAANIAAAIDLQLGSRGLRAGDSVLFATGGGGGLLGAAVGRVGGFAGVYAFPVSPVFSAFGLSRLNVTHDYEAMPTLEAIEPTLARLKEMALADMRSEGFEPGSIALHLEAERAEGRAVVVESLGGDLVLAAQAVRQDHARLRLIRLKATAPGRHAALPAPGNMVAAATTPAGTRPVFWDDQARPTPVLDWSALGQGTAVEGGSILETGETTVLVPPGLSGRIGALGELFIALRQAGTGGQGSRLATEVPA